MWRVTRPTDTGRRVGRTALAIVLAVAASAVWALPSWAGASGGDGPGGTVTVGASGGGATGGGPASPGAPGSGGGTPASPWTCTSMYLALNNQPGIPPGGPLPGAWYSVTCTDAATGIQTSQTVWLTTPPSGGAPPVDPYALAVQAESSMVLPRPTIQVDPAGAAIVNLPTWLWIDPTIWHAEQVSATAGGVTATVVAVPVSVAFSMGDGGTVVCAGPGTPYDPSRPASVQTTACSYKYRTSSIGQPSPDGNPNDAAFTVSAAVTWAVSWSALGAPGGGALPTIDTSSSIPLRVVQVESLNALAGPA